MTINRLGFPSIIPDNDTLYIDFISTALTHADPEAIITIDKRDASMRVTISPSLKDFKQHVIDNILNAHRLLKLKVIFSKSLAISKSVSYIVEL